MASDLKSAALETFVERLTARSILTKDEERAVRALDAHQVEVPARQDFDPAVRLLICEVLGELSYEAIEAGDATAALPILRAGGRIDLMISDVGLPGMNGRQLAEIAREHRPELPILFVTGYAENAAIRAGFLGTNMAMITKPFAMNALAEKVAKMLGWATKSARN
jgi:CheY-like chemotaxis protein